MKTSNKLTYLACAIGIISSIATQAKDFDFTTSVAVANLDGALEMTETQAMVFPQIDVSSNTDNDTCYTNSQQTENPLCPGQTGVNDATFDVDGLKNVTVDVAIAATGTVTQSGITFDVDNFDNITSLTFDADGKANLSVGGKLTLADKTAVSTTEFETLNFSYQIQLTAQ